MKYVLIFSLLSAFSVNAQTVPTGYPTGGFIDETGGSGESAGLAIKKAAASDHCEALEQEPAGLVVWHDGTGKSHGCVTEDDAKQFHNYCNKGIVTATAAKANLIKRFTGIPKNACKMFQVKEEAKKVNSSARKAGQNLRKSTSPSVNPSTGSQIKQQ